MKLTGTIKIIDATRSGVSHSTGNPWYRKSCVVEVAEEGVGASTIACSTFNTDVIAKLETCKIGDEVELSLRIHTNARPFTYSDGTQGMDRSNDVTILNVEEASF